MKLDFEKIAYRFQSYFKISSISHCDFVKVENDKIRMIEKTTYIDKNLLDRDIYNKEVIEVAKKMWGSFATAVWLWARNLKNFPKERHFILEISVKQGFERILSQFIKDVRMFKNGAYDEVKIKLKVVKRQ